MALPRSCFAAAALVLGLAGCASTPSTEATQDAAEPASATLPPEGRVRILQVAGQRVPCTGVAPMLCLQVRSTPGAAWEAHYFEIEGFNWQVGVEYVIRVRELPVPNPPADGSSVRWVLEEVLERFPPG